VRHGTIDASPPASLRAVVDYSTTGRADVRHASPLTPGNPLSLSESQREHLERRLLEERARVVDSLRRYEQENRVSEREQSGNLSSVPFHPADLGTDTNRQELEASVAARETAELAQIDDALRRLYDEPERFGRDERTGDDIPFERLDLVPWTRTAAGSTRR
jgi:RNA polymerase-binding transcription factor DksA